MGCYPRRDGRSFRDHDVRSRAAAYKQRQVNEGIRGGPKVCPGTPKARRAVRSVIANPTKHMIYGTLTKQACREKTTCLEKEVITKQHICQTGLKTALLCEAIRRTYAASKNKLKP